MTVVKFTEVLDGFEFGAFGAMVTNQAFISLERGTVHFVSSELSWKKRPRRISTVAITLPCRTRRRLGWGASW